MFWGLIIETIKWSIGFQKVEMFEMVSKMAAIIKQNSTWNPNRS